MESLRKTREDIRGNLKIIRGTSGKTQGETWGKPEGKPGKIKGKPKDNADKPQENPKKQREENQRKTRESRGNTKGKTYGKPNLGEAWAKLGRNLEWLYARQGKSMENMRKTMGNPWNT